MVALAADSFDTQAHFVQRTGQAEIHQRLSCFEAEAGHVAAEACYEEEHSVRHTGQVLVDCIRPDLAFD